MTHLHSKIFYLTPTKPSYLICMYIYTDSSWSWNNTLAYVNIWRAIDLRDNVPRFRSVPQLGAG